jgi:hypothetical protein
LKALNVDFYYLQGGTVLIAGGLTLRNGVESITLLQLVAGKAWQSRSEDT